MGTIKAIETRYKGYRFRSRLEARWAVFLDAMGVDYEYELEGFDLGDFWYLPDFYLPEHECWIEIKGKPPSEYDLKKIATFCLKSEEGEVHVFVGDPYRTVYSYESFDTISWEIHKEVEREYGEGYDTCFMGIKDEYGYVQNYGERGFVFYDGELMIIPYGDDSTRGEEVEEAAVRARSARFEHGETPT